jgi:hypothetical protein
MQVLACRIMRNLGARRTLIQAARQRPPTIFLSLDAWRGGMELGTFL